MPPVFEFFLVCLCLEYNKGPKIIALLSRFDRTSDIKADFLHCSGQLFRFRLRNAIVEFAFLIFSKYVVSILDCPKG